MRYSIPIALTVFCFGCSVNIKIAYKTKDVERIQDDQLSTLTIDIEEFTDKRKDHFENSILFVERNLCKMNGRSVLINAERNYKKQPVTRQMTKVLVEHLNKTHVFGKTITNKKDSADYYITGNLTKFYGVQDFSFSSSVYAGVMAGSSGEMTPGKIVIEIRDLKIFSKNGQIVKDLGNYKKEYEGPLPNGGIWSCIFMNVNDTLKEYNSGLIKTLEAEIRNVEQTRAALSKTVIPH